MNIRLKIHLIQFHNLSLLDKLPDDKHDEHDRQLNVETDETDTVECRAEATPSLNENQKAVEEDADPGSVGICPVFERQ